MGHKGVSKRKSSKTKLEPLSKDKAGSSIASESQPGKAADVGKATPAAKGGAKPSSQSTKKSK